jgi:two-component system sensor histidine kinase GlrK
MNSNPHDLTPESDPFQSVKAKARDLTFGYAVHIEEEARSLESLSLKTKQSLVFHIVLLLSISCIVLVVFVYLLHHPIRQIDLFIRTLGAGNFTQPIRVAGTRDVEFLGERLEWLRTHLNDLEMAKQRFMRNVSHEIKTPLATIHEGADLLLDEVVGVLNREQKDIAGILVSNADKMDKLIAKLINYSQVSARRTRQRFARVDMRLLVNELLEEYRLQLLNRSITVAESIQPVELFVDKEQMRTIVDNLLSNAVKYSPEGGEIRLSLKENAGHMELEIEDDGPGIDPDEREKVFEPLYLGRSSRALGIKGTGFGLAIVAECVASYFGKVEVLASHEEHAGAHIRVKIPLQSLNYRKSTDDNLGSSNP